MEAKDFLFSPKAAGIGGTGGMGRANISSVLSELIEDAEREVNEEWGLEWRSANFAYGSSVYSSARVLIRRVLTR